MRTLTLIAVIAVVLLEITDVLPTSSVGGPLTLMLVFLVAMLAAGILEAWTKRRGVVGWIVSILAAVVGGFLGAGLGGFVMEAILTTLALGEPLATSHHPLRYIGPAAVMVLTMAGAWMVLQVVNRMR